MPPEEYVPPAVWRWEKPSGGVFAAINRPTAGATHDVELPRGGHPFQLYSSGTPNGQKVTILFEELLAAGHADAEYDAWLINLREGGQFGSGFVGINPNSKIPALLDRSGAMPIRVFESGAILLHLAEAFGAFIPQDPRGRAECLSWLFWQMGSGPLIGGAFGHFFAYAPEKMEYPINRYAMEVKRLLDVAEQRLRVTDYIAGDEYSIADIAIYGWFGSFARGEAYDGAAEFLDFASYGEVNRWAAEVGARPAVRRGIRVNRQGEGYVEERHSAADIDAVMR